MRTAYVSRVNRGALLVAAGLLAAAAGCSSGGSTDETSEDPQAAASADGLGAAPSGTADDPVGTDAGSTGGSTGGGTNGNTGSGDTGDTNTGNAGTGGGPRIVYFRVKQKPSCPQGTNLHTVPGRPLVIEWKVAGASQVDLAVDGPGLYNRYGAQGTETFTFSCGGAPGSSERHTYTLTPAGGQPKTISASATVNEITVVDDPTPGQ